MADKHPRAVRDDGPELDRWRIGRDDVIKRAEVPSGTCSGNRGLCDVCRGGTCERDPGVPT